MGVTSKIDVTFNPAALSALTAASLPEPGPLTRTWTLANPKDMASSAAFWAARVAANGVLFREPLNPTCPELANEIAFPNLSVRVIMVLLNVALICAIPSGSTFAFLFFFTDFFGFAKFNLLR